MKKTDTSFSGLSEQEIIAVENFSKNIDAELRKQKNIHGLSNKDIADLLYPLVNGEDKVSKIGANPQTCKDVRHCNLQTVAGLRLVFGISIDALLDQEHEPRNNFDEPPQN